MTQWESLGLAGLLIGIIQFVWLIVLHISKENLAYRVSDLSNRVARLEGRADGNRDKLDELNKTKQLQS